MHSLIATSVLLLAGTAPAPAKPPPALTVQLECFDAWKDSDLSRSGGGPGGAQWNTEAVVCEARLDASVSLDIHSVQLRLEVGQGQALTRVGELYVLAHPRQELSLGFESEVEAISAAAERSRSFFIPAPVFSRLLRKVSRQPGTGADVYRARFVLTARGLDAQGRTVATVRDEVKAEFAYGE